MNSIENASSRQRKKELCITSTTRPAVIPMNQDGPADEIAQTILNAENDIFYLSDLDTYELYYLNQAGQKIFGVKDYFGKSVIRFYTEKTVRVLSVPTLFCGTILSMCGKIEMNTVAGIFC